jgi:hypothetical protein
VKNTFFTWHPHRDSILHSAFWFCGFLSPGFCLSTQQISVWFEAGSSCMAPQVRFISLLHWVCRNQVRQFIVRLSLRVSHCLLVAICR